MMTACATIFSRSPTNTSPRAAALESVLSPIQNAGSDNRDI
jgi:hypothetical protein